MIASAIANWLAFGGLVFLVCSASVTFAFAAVMSAAFSCRPCFT